MEALQSTKDRPDNKSVNGSFSPHHHHVGDRLPEARPLKQLDIVQQDLDAADLVHLALGLVLKCGWKGSSLEDSGQYLSKLDSLLNVSLLAVSGAADPPELVISESQ